jgi:hypothetical protein
MLDVKAYRVASRSVGSDGRTVLCTWLVTGDLEEALLKRMVLIKTRKAYDADVEEVAMNVLVSWNPHVILEISHEY